MAEVLTSGEGQLLNNKLENLLESVKDLKGAVVKMGDTLSTLVRVEERQIEQAKNIERAFTEVEYERKRIDDNDARIAAVVADIPSLKELRRWIIGGMGAVFLAIVAAIFSGTIVLHFVK